MNYMNKERVKETLKRELVLVGRMCRQAAGFGIAQDICVTLS